jgi:hypothetical protein
MRKLLARRWNQKGKKKIRVQQCIEEVMADIKIGLKATVSYVIVFQERKMHITVMKGLILNIEEDMVKLVKTI